jgi:hypothetical protein
MALRKIKKATKQEAVKRTAERRKQWKSLETGWLALGRAVEQDVALHVPEALGTTFTAWLESTFDCSASKVFQAFRASKALKGIPEEKLNQITQANAVRMATLPEKERKSPEWVKKAVELPMNEFKSEVEAHIEKKTGIKKEKWHTFRVGLPKDVYDLVLEAEFKMAGILEVDISDTSKNQAAARLTVWEAFAALINLTDESILKAEVQGLREGKVPDAITATA